MTRTRILLVDDNRLWLQTLKSELAKHHELDVFIADNGISALEMIKNFSVDIVLSGVVMHGFDGFALLEAIQHLNIKPPMIMFMSLLCNDDIIKRASAFGVTYFFRKPVSPETIYDRINFFISDKKENIFLPEDAETIAGRIIKDFGIPANIGGYKFVRDSIIFSIEHENEVCRITKNVYPAVAEKYGTTPARVERSIRNAIATSWHRADKNAIFDIFGNTTGDKPTNGEFIAAVAEKVRLILRKNRYMH